MQAMTFDQFFDTERIAEPYAPPEIFAHRIARIELMPGDCIRLWHVVDLPSHSGIICGSTVVVKLIYPLASFLPSRTFTSLWMWRNGLMIPQVGGNAGNTRLH